MRAGKEIRNSELRGFLERICNRNLSLLSIGFD